MKNSLESLGIKTKKPYIRFIQRGIVVLIGIVLIAAAIWYFRKRSDVSPQWVTTRVSRGDLVATVSATGTLQPIRTVDVGAEASGRVSTVYADINDRVTEGQVLVELDQEPFLAPLSQRRASLREAQASITIARIAKEEAQNNLTRIEQLFQNHFSTDAEMESARAALSRADAEINAAVARAQLASATLRESSTNLGKTVIRSPINGIVLSRTVEPGQAVAAALQSPVLFQLAEDLRHMELQVDVDEADVGRVREGQEVTFVVDAYPDRQFHGRITRIAYAGQLVENVVSYKTVIEVDNQEGLLRPLMTATATIITETRKQVLVVSNSALRFSPPREASFGANRNRNAPRGPTLWVLRQNQPIQIAVQVLATDDSRTEIHGPSIREGMEVLVDVRGRPE